MWALAPFFVIAIGFVILTAAIGFGVGYEMGIRDGRTESLRHWKPSVLPPWCTKCWTIYTNWERNK